MPDSASFFARGISPGHNSRPHRLQEQPQWVQVDHHGAVVGGTLQHQGTAMAVVIQAWSTERGA